MIKTLFYVWSLFKTEGVSDPKPPPQPGPPPGPIPREFCSSEDWNVTCFDDTGYITMDPKGEHDTTIIFLHGSNSFATYPFKFINDGKLAPLTARVVLPQATY